ncbi:murein L,D-transpeptidase catalytic domain family protein [Pontibacter actiniarum]|uniref:Murein L,D-transpeptidase catalytic domain family protein n=1 Tax=Pontibacter actiniarum TaxID=323450 RepID=A0A1X9YQI6_9BACT|nr:murein L,D-transpeptidase catalytic domain family protein [Pontibacter actiniarum]ARS35129.1 hypothetical protein CA264_06550 [Pontibacter actiniarum]
MVRVLLTSITLGLLSFTSPVPKDAAAITAPLALEAKDLANSSLAAKAAVFEDHVQELYNEANLEQKGLSYQVFHKAVVGFQNFKRLKMIAPSKSVLSVVDFTKPSSEKRLWIIDLKSKKVLFNTLVAHGRNTGEGKATRFSNTPNSNMSSLGFYLTDATYFGKHGLSLRLQGKDEGFNTNAMARAIVVHGADYVSEDFVKQYGRLGRSLGCPSVPKEVSKDVIEAIKDKSVLYIHGNDAKYSSTYLNNNQAVEAFALENGADAAISM